MVKSGLILSNSFILPDTWTQIEVLNLSRNQLTGLPVSDSCMISFLVCHRNPLMSRNALQLMHAYFFLCHKSVPLIGSMNHLL